MRWTIWAVALVAVIASWFAELAWPALDGLFVEALGTAFAVLVIDQLIRVAEDRRIEPARRAAFRDACDIVNDSRALLSQALEAGGQHVSRTEVQSLDPARMAPELARIAGMARMADPARVLGCSGFGDAFVFRTSELRARINEYLSRHTPTGDPSITEAIQDLESCMIFMSSDAFRTVRSNRKPPEMPQAVWDAINTGILISNDQWQEFLTRLDVLISNCRRVAAVNGYVVKDRGFNFFDAGWLEAVGGPEAKAGD